MRTRSLTRQAVDQGGGVMVTDTSTPGDINSEHEERSSVTTNHTQPSAVSISATNLNIDSEPVLSASDKRIKHLLAQTCMQKFMLDNHIKDLEKQASRHKEYVKDGEEAEMLVDRAVQLKINVKKGEGIEESLISNFSNLKLLLELLNMEGDEEQRTEGVRLANKVTAGIEKYEGKVETFRTSTDPH